MTKKTDKEQENKGKSPNPPEKMAEKAPAVPTFGMKTHNEITYRGVDFFLNSMLGVSIAFATNRREWGKNYIAKPINNFYTKCMQAFSKNPETIKAGASWGGRITSIIIGGMLIIPGMVLLENKKVKKNIIKQIDTLKYGKDAVENDPRFEEAYREIDNEPKKDFTTGMLSRFAVLIPMIAVTMSPLNKHMEKMLYEPIGKITKWGAKMVGIQPKKLMQNMSEEIVHGKPKQVSDWDYLHTTIGLDFGLTFIYSYCHEFAYKAFAKLRNVNTETPPEVIAPANVETYDKDVQTANWRKREPAREGSYVSQVTNRQQSANELMMR